MSAVDIVLLLILLISVVLGLWRGLVYEVLSVLAWVAAFFLAQWYAQPVADNLPLGETAQPLRFAAGFAVVFVGTVFAGGLMAWLLKQLVETAGLRPVDRILGGVFGVVRAAVLLLALTLVVGMTPLHQHETWQASQGAVWLETGLHGLRGMMPESLAQYIR